MVKGLFGFILGVFLMVSCAALPSFPFKYYTLDAEDYTGTLKGPEGRGEDLDFKRCLPTEGDKAPCMVMFTSSFLKMRDEYRQMKVDLKTCQAGK